MVFIGSHDEFSTEPIVNNLFSHSGCFYLIPSWSEHCRLEGWTSEKANWKELCIGFCLEKFTLSTCLVVLIKTPAFLNVLETKSIVIFFLLQMKSVAMESFLVPVSFAVSRVKSSGLCLLFTNRCKRWSKNALALPRKKEWIFLLWKTLETVSVQGSFPLGVKPVQWLAILGSASKTFFLYTRLCCDEVAIIKYISHGDTLSDWKSHL